jgi:hypothetical protein
VSIFRSIFRQADTGRDQDQAATHRKKWGSAATPISD